MTSFSVRAFAAAGIVLRLCVRIKCPAAFEESVGPGIKLVSIDPEPLASDPYYRDRRTNLAVEQSAAHAQIGRCFADPENSRQDCVLHSMCLFEIPAAGSLPATLDRCAGSAGSTHEYGFSGRAVGDSRAHTLIVDLYVF